MEMIDMLLHLQDLEHRCRELSKDEYVYKKDMEVLKMAKGVIWDKINENKLSEKNSDSDIITVKDMCGDEDFASLGFYVHLVWNNKDSYDPTIKPIW